MDTIERIPDDIRRAAADIMDNACLPERLITSGMDSALRHDIARALLAERERCMKIAEDEVRKCLKASDAAKAAGKTAEMYARNAGFHSAHDIAAAIRA